MLRILNLNIPLDYTDALLKTICSRKLHCSPSDILSIQIAHQAVDARNKANVHFVVNLDVHLRHEASALKRLPPNISVAPEYLEPSFPSYAGKKRPLVVGAGPAGLFAALVLAKAGACPILIERGKSVDDRAADVHEMFEHGRLNFESNVQFGEGGAGAFSDGKLTTGIKSPYLPFVFRTFVEHGAPEEILTSAKPHIGTDRLRPTIASMRKEIQRLGGTVWFSTCLLELELHEQTVIGAFLMKDNARIHIETDSVVLCIGHSSRDTFETLHHQGVHMIAKPFAVGVRIEHPQKLINQIQYGPSWDHPRLGAAPYKLNVHTADGRGVYTFCMCPGGYVVPSASEPDSVCVNGMSNYARNGENANAALLVGIRPEDFPPDHVMAGFQFQRDLEKKAFQLGGGGYKAPVQRLEDFLLRRPSKHIGSVEPTYRPGYALADLHECLPKFVADNLRTSLALLDRQMHGFAYPDAILTGVEARSSCPVRLPRSLNGTSESISGLYPAGEGAGYAGGIVSAAVDGINQAMHVLNGVS